MSPIHSREDDKENTCPICGCQNSRIIGRTKWRLWGHGPDLMFPVVYCRHCDLGYAQQAPSEAAVQRYFCQLNKYNEEERTEFWKRMREPVFETALEVIRKRVPPPARLLDVGCAYGCFLKMAAGYGYQVRGFEISAGASDIARKLLGSNVIVYEEDLGAADFGGARFDVTTLWDVLYYSPHPSQFLCQIRDLLRPGGHLFMRVGNRAWLLKMASRFGFTLQGHGDALLHFSVKSLRKILDRCGFELIEVHPAYSPVTSYGPVAHCLAKAIAYTAQYLSCGKVNVHPSIIVAARTKA